MGPLTEVAGKGIGSLGRNSCRQCPNCRRSGPRQDYFCFGLRFVARPGALIIAAAFADLTRADRDTLCLNGLVRIEPADYLALPMPPTPADLGLKD